MDIIFSIKKGTKSIHLLSIMTQHESGEGGETKNFCHHSVDYKFIMIMTDT